MKNICLLFFAVALCLSSYAQYVDLGLPSGTKWKSTNETGGNNGLYTYDEAIKFFGNKLPTKEQCEELIDKCEWKWQKGKKAYKVKGPNGKTIILPAAGFRNCGGNVYDVGSVGVYWSSAPNGSDNAWSLDFNSDGVYIDYYTRCDGQSVRLVQ